jgi:hypothetical protein
VFGVFVSVIQLAAIVNAFARSLRARYILGAVAAVAAVARGVLLISGAVAALLVRRVTFPGSDVPAPAGPMLVALVATIAGPLVSFAMLGIAYRRMRNLPAAEEQRASRPFGAWLPVALLDAAFLVINGFALYMARES